MKTRVLFNWKPRELDATLGTRFRRRLIRAGLKVHPYGVEVRSLAINAIGTAGQLGWHRDQVGSKLDVVMWSNTRPTLVRFADGSLLESQNGDVIFVDNAEVEHCAPSDQSERWFLRTLVAKKVS